MSETTIATFNEVEPARVLCRRLELAGIDSWIDDQSELERFWFLTEPLASVHVDVENLDYQKAQMLVHEWESSMTALKQAVRCPDCHSSRIEYPQITRKFMMPVVQALLMKLHMMPKTFYCMDCHYTWPSEVKPEPERNVLGWRVAEPKTTGPSLTGALRK